MVQLGQVTSLPDAQLVSMFNFTIPVVPGGGSSDALLIRNLTAVLPGRSHEVIKVELKRHVTHQLGKQKFNNTFNARFIDTKDCEVIKACKQWQANIIDPATGLPFEKANYRTTGIATLFGADRKVIETRTFFGLALASVGDVQLDGASESLVNYDLQFVFDYWL